jgi:hypothetical protein
LKQVRQQQIVEPVRRSSPQKATSGAAHCLSHGSLDVCGQQHRVSRPTIFSPFNHHNYPFFNKMAIGRWDAISLTYDREDSMIALLSITTLTVATLFALAAATAFHWLLLRLTLRVMRPAALRPESMRPAAAHPIAARSELVRGTAGLTRAFAAHR